MASARLRSWVRKRWAWITITPSLVMRWPASRFSRSAASSGSVIRRGVEAQLRGGRELVDVLPAGTGGAHEADLDVVLVDREVAGNPQHGVTGSGHARAIARSASCADVPGIHVVPVRQDETRGWPGSAASLRSLRERLLCAGHDGERRKPQFAFGGAAAGCAAACGARPTITVSRPWPHSRLAALLGVVERHGIDDGVALLDVVDRQLVELVLQQRRCASFEEVSSDSICEPLR